MLLVVRKNDLDVATPLEDRTSRTASLRNEALDASGSLGVSPMHDQRFCLQAVVVFGISNSRGESLSDCSSRLAGYKLKHRKCLNRAQTLDLSYDFPDLLRGHSEILEYGLNFHNVGSLLLGFGLGGVSAVFLERAGERKLTEFVPYHVLCYEDRAKRSAIVHAHRQSHEFGGNGGAA